MLVSFRLRAHVHCCHNMQPVPDWRLECRAAKRPQCTEGLFDRLLHTIFSRSRQTLQVQYPGRVGISDDEMTFLQAASLHQHQQPAGAEFLLHPWRTPHRRPRRLSDDFGPVPEAKVPALFPAVAA